MTNKRDVKPTILTLSTATVELTYEQLLVLEDALSSYFPDLAQFSLNKENLKFATFSVKNIVRDTLNALEEENDREWA